MKNLWSLARSSAVALGLAGLMAVPAAAAPLGPLDLPVKAGASTSVVPASDRWEGRYKHRLRRDRGEWGRDRGEWRRDRGEWRSHRRHRDHYRRHYRSHGPSIYFNFSVPTYRYVQPHYVPRYRYSQSSAHVQWCYDRYRSYRAYDNTFQPYHGYRQQCWSPYS